MYTDARKSTIWTGVGGEVVLGLSDVFPGTCAWAVLVLRLFLGV